MKIQKAVLLSSGRLFVYFELGEWVCLESIEGVEYDINNMKIFVKAKPSAKEEKIEKIDDINFIVWVKEPPKEGRANRALARALANYFNVALLSVNLVSGFSSRQKVFEVKK